jgi:ketosteroid isomerase-like protein
MSPEREELLRRMVDVINTGGDPHDLVTDDLELRNPTTAVTDATYVGPEGALKWREDMFDVFEGARYQIDEVLDEGDDYVVVANSLVGRGVGSGVPVDLRWTGVFWIRDGKLARGAGFNTRREALEAARAP